MNNVYFFLLFAAALCVSSCVKSEYSYPPHSAAPAPPAPEEAVSYVNETFDNIAKVDGQVLPPPAGWTSFALAGVRTFQTGVLARKGGGVMRGAMGSAYLSTDAVNDFWLMMPPLDVSDSTATLSFQAGLTYSSASTQLSLMYSAAYRGGAEAINLSEWTELPVAAAPTSSGPVEMTAQAPISFWGKGGERNVVYAAFRYRSVVSLESIAADDADRANYYLDNVVFRKK